MSSTVKLDKGPFGTLLRTQRQIPAGEIVMHITGEEVTAPTMHTIQLEDDLHLVSRDGLWINLNHSCSPSTRLDIPNRAVVALRDLAPGDELTFNYLTTEWSMAAPFECGCGADSCVGTVRGFRYLNSAQRAALMPHVSPYLTQRIEYFGRNIKVALGFGPFGELLRVTKPIQANEVILFISGELADHPNKFTIQLDATRHILTNNGLWKSANHGCVPNIIMDVEAGEMRAIRDLAVGEEICFNYNTTELDMASPFDCGCGAASCTGYVQGFLHLNRDQREAIRPWISPFIAEHFDDPQI